MLNQGFEPTIDHSWIPSSAWRSARLLERRRAEERKADLLDDIPVMSATVLALDMLVQEPFVDLQAASEIILSDVGATIQILRLIGNEHGIGSERPGRMGECLASLDVTDWLGAISGRSFICDRQHVSLTVIWRHCQQIARYAQLVAESMDDIFPEDAYLVGLLHGADAIAAALDWSDSPRVNSGEILLDAMEGTMPLFVLAALSSSKGPSPSPWKFILSAAHELARDPIECIPFAADSQLGEERTLAQPEDIDRVRLSGTGTFTIDSSDMFSSLL